MQPDLLTPRLVLRPFGSSDAADVQRLAGDIRVARGATAIPHPYPDGAAQAWIGGHQDLFVARREVVYAVLEREPSRLVGAVSLLNVSAAHARAELGFWIGAEFWSRGYCTEAADKLIDFGARSLGITRFVGRCLAWNAASAAVLKKVGMVQEGCLALHELRDGQFVDQLLFGRVLPGRQSEA